MAQTGVKKAAAAAARKRKKMPSQATRLKRVGSLMEKQSRKQKKKHFDKTRTIEHSRTGRGKAY